MNRKLKPTKSAKQIQHEQSGLIQKKWNIKQYKKQLETENIIRFKKCFESSKKSYQAVTKENKQLKQYMTNIKQQKYQQQQQQQQEQIYYRPQKYKRVV